MPELILKWPDKRLTQYCNEVTSFGPAIQEEIKAMEETLLATPNGLALAAPQIGVMKRMIVIKPNKFKLQGPIINPEIIDQSEDYVSELEGCLSFPGMYADVMRPKWAQLKYQDVSGVEQECRVSLLLCRVMSHEIDHLNGVLFTKYVRTKVRATIEKKMRKKK